MRYLIFLYGLVLLGACESDPRPQLRVMSDQVALRDTAGLKSTEILILKTGDQVKHLGKVSAFESIVEWQGKILQSPWVKVDAAGKEGWVLAALVSPEDQEYRAWMEQNRMLCYFGEPLTRRRQVWLRDSTKLGTDAEVAAYHREAVALRDTFMTLLARRAEWIEGSTAPDYSWLRPFLPGFVAQKVPGRNMPYFFSDYNYWIQKSVASQGTQDDAFFELCTGIFPYDRIESYFPVWQFQIDDRTAASQLGTGKHVGLLMKIEKKLPETKLFHPEMLRIKDQILDDIAGRNSGYWQSDEKILAELNKIMETQFSFLDERDRILLQTRYQMFEAAKENGIKVNLRSGQE